MPKVTIYLSDELYREAKARDLSLSKLAQDAVQRAVEASSTRDWVAHVRNRPPRYHGAHDGPELLATVREDFGS